MVLILFPIPVSLALLLGSWEINEAMIEIERAHGVVFIQHTSIGHLPYPKHGMRH